MFQVEGRPLPSVTLAYHDYIRWVILIYYPFFPLTLRSDRSERVSQLMWVSCVRGPLRTYCADSLSSSVGVPPPVPLSHWKFVPHPTLTSTKEYLTRYIKIRWQDDHAITQLPKQMTRLIPANSEQSSTKRCIRWMRYLGEWNWCHWRRCLMNIEG
jgi:hypothetical protein